MSETMIQRVARALYESKAIPGDDWATESEVHREFCRRQARVAIEAMREPTQAMLDAGADHMHEAIDFSPEPGEGIDGYDVSPVWDAMIDAALTD